METSTQVKLDRKTIERNRRIHMKALIYKLTSIVPPQHFKPSKDMLSQQDQIDQVADYIKQLRERVEKLEKRKQEAMSSSSSSSQSDKNVENLGIRTPVVKVRDVGSSLEVFIISGKKKCFGLHEIVRIVEEEGAEVTSASISTIGLNVYHILHAQVKVLRFGIDTSILYDRFQTLISEITSK